MSWAAGRQQVRERLRRGDLQQVAVSPELVHALLDQARTHLSSADLIRATDRSGAYTALYDAARKALVALLQAQGLRPTSRGGHRVISDVVGAQFPEGQLRDAFRPFDRMRQRRNAVEYPTRVDPVSRQEIDEDLKKARRIVEHVEQLVESVPVFVA